MMNADKFLTDLAALTGCETVGVTKCFSGDYMVHFGKYSSDVGWQIFEGEGPTVEAAMQEARAKLAEHYEGEAA